jgi:hypothetical protein
MYVIKLVIEGPLILCVVDLEAAIRRDTFDQPGI